MDKGLVDTIYLIADNLALLYHRLDAIEDRLAAIEEDQRLNWALTRQIWLNPAPGFVRRGPSNTPARQERIPAPLPAKPSGVSIPIVE